MSSVPPTTSSAVPASKPARLPARKAPTPAASGFLAGVVRFFASFGLAVTLLLMLMVLVVAGTLAQRDMSIVDVQAKYFSWYFEEQVGKVTVPFPGAALVLAVLSVNLVVGGLIRIRKGTATLGVIIAHCGILILFGSGLVEYLLADKGQLTLYENDSGDTFQSYTDWEMVARERKPNGAATEYVFGAGVLDDLDLVDTARFESQGLPFTVVVTKWTRNGVPDSGGGRETNGIRIKPVDPAKQAEANMPGAYVALEPKSRSDAAQRTWMWGVPDVVPWVVRVAGRVFEIELRHQRWPLPFSLELTRFVHKRHPGTMTDAEFSSYVTKREGDTTRDVHITMNEPLRSSGYILYQASWGPTDAGPGDRLFSVFAVVDNPSDRWPIFACAVIAGGMILHFVRKLFLYVRAENKRLLATPARSLA